MGRHIVSNRHPVRGARETPGERLILFVRAFLLPRTPALDGFPRHSSLPTRRAFYLCPCNPRSLDQLGYRQPLGIESVPLVERLFSDLVHTTESL